MAFYEGGCHYRPLHLKPGKSVADEDKFLYTYMKTIMDSPEDIGIWNAPVRLYPDLPEDMEAVSSESLMLQSSEESLEDGEIRDSSSDTDSRQTKPAESRSAAIPVSNMSGGASKKRTDKHLQPALFLNTLLSPPLLI